MATVDIVLLMVRWLHVLTAAALVGGCMFYLISLRLARPEASSEVEAAKGSHQVKTEKSKLAEGFLAIIVASGVVLGLDRLSRPEVNSVYFALLALKLLLAAGTLSLVRRLVPARGIAGRGLPARRVSRSASNLTLALGAATFLASVLLRAVFEVALRRG